MPDASPPPTPDPSLAALIAAEDALIRTRREHALDAPPAGSGETDARHALPRVGLAISGGGVRSATFGLGLLRGLAQRGVLARIDYLSTVSGGGFVGAMFGRMVCALGIHEAQAMLARGASPALDWVRRNGRYLTPGGARDLGIAFVTYLRAIVAIHIETFLVCLPGALLVLLPHLLLQAQGGGFDPARWQDWHTPWWPLALAVWIATAPATMAAYWSARDTPVVPLRDVVLIAIVGTAALVTTFAAWPGAAAFARADGAALAVGAALLALWSCTLGLVAARWHLQRATETRSLAVARLRNWLTRALRWVTLTALGLAAIGALDVVSWWLLEVMQSGANWIWGGVGVGGAAVIVMRTLAQPLQQLAERGKQSVGGQSDWGPRLLDLAGLAGLVALLLAWLVLVQWIVFAPEPVAALRDYAGDVRALGLAVLGVGWWLLTARNEQMANASSLHTFYRARLTRAYLAVGNAARGIVVGQPAPGAASVREVIPGDDIDLAQYRPEACGGPIHLVSACLNQTRDDTSGLYNADRKGTLATASSRALEIGPREAVATPPNAGTLGRWLAISGAAAAPGAGSYTSAGWSLLLFFLGVRLGYWLRAPLELAAGWSPGVQRAWTTIVKPMMLWSEVAASYYGRARPWWYLSDGGHFDNTGVYPLLKRRLDFIILADNSADATYRLADIENLVRKARIDFGAEIEFYTREEAARHFADARGEITVLSPETLADNYSARGVLLARVRYAAGADGTRAEATLLVVKPNLHDALDLDLLAYAQRHPTFPHESTSDQSFDEAQWESYHRLGEDIGRAIALPWLDALPGWTRVGTHPMTIAARLRGNAAVAAEAAATEPLWRRSARATAIGATLGLGASGTLLLALWQVGEQFRLNAAAEQAEAQRLFTEVSRDLRDLDGSCPKVAEHTAIQLMMLRDLSEGDRLRPLEREGVALLMAHVGEECTQQPAASLECAEAAHRAAAGICAVVNRPSTRGTALSYWHPTPGRITLASLWSHEAEETRVASAPTAPAEQQPAPAAPPPPIVTRGDGSAPAEAPAAEPAPPPPPPPAAPCASTGHTVQLYVQIYDEASRPAAAAVVKALQAEIGDVLAIAPVENVTAAAALRNQRRPAPWPQPTLIVHGAAEKPCAADLAAVVRAALPPLPGRDPAVWVRELPRSLKATPGVIELWIPPRDKGSETAGS